ncbi:MAG: hypothetical protein HY203_05295 [Nitrospirae bacterium]|nr:hypothetical protein [Nitrospirota bacterium]
MKSYNNLPPQQRLTQRLADQFNADERLWRGLEGKRKRRRELGPRLSKKRHKQLDQLEFAKARPSQDCISVEIPSGQPPYGEGKGRGPDAQWERLPVR